MRSFYALLFVAAFAFVGGSVFGQVAGDTLGLTGTVGDTVVANRLFKQATGLVKKQVWKDAEAKGEVAKSIYERVFGEESRQVADALYQLGMVKYFEGEYNSAIKIHQKTLNIREKIFGEIHPQVASVCNIIGVSFEKMGIYMKAIEFKQKALDVRLKIYGPSHPEVASSYNNLGVAYDLLGELKTAADLKEEGLRVRIKSLPPNSIDLASSYNSVANTVDKMGDNDKALDFRKKALDIRVTNFGYNHIDVASSFNNLGVSFFSKGAYYKAQEYYLKAIEILNSILGPEHPDIAAGYNNIGVFYIEVGDYIKASKYLNLSLRLRTKLFKHLNRDISQSYFNIGYYYDKMAMYDSAFVYYNKSFIIDSTLLGANHLINASTMKRIGGLYKSMGEFSQSILLYSNALEVEAKFLKPNHSDLLYTINEIGTSYFLSGNLVQSINHFNMALRLNNYLNESSLDSVQSLDELVISLSNISKVQNSLYILHHDINHLKTSYHYATQALAAIGHLQNLFTEDITKSLWQTKNYPIYEQAISVSLLKADVDKNDTLRHHTFTYAEKSKATLLQAQIKAADAINFSGIPDSLLQQEHQLRIDLTWREKQRQSLLDKGLTETDTNTLRISGIIFDLKRDYETLKLRFEKEYPEYYRLKYDLSTASLRYVQDSLLEPQQALLEYFVGDSSIYLFVVRPDTFIVKEVKRDFPLEDWIAQLRQGLYGYYTLDKSKRTDVLKLEGLRQYLEYGPKLYEKLVAPVQPYLPRKVVLVPDGPLGYVPFDALLTEPPIDTNAFNTYPYLFKKHQFSYTYSATLLKEMREKKHRRQPAKTFASFAPFYSGDSLIIEQDLFSSTRKGFKPLPYTKIEVDGLRQLMGGDMVAGAYATEGRFVEMAGNYRLLHLATHGVADNRVGDYAFLAFSELKDSVENELLYVKDLYNLELNADLVVLSACETGVGKLQRGEGIISLARAFAYAGAKSIVTTLWEVNDKSTSELMRYFYRELRNGKAKDEALWLARRAYFDKSQERTCHPFFWAAFVPVGDMRPVFKAKR